MKYNQSGGKNFGGIMANNQLQDPIIITGAARSGTSMIAGTINMCGAFGGRMSGPTINNKKGMFENAYVRNNIVKPYLESLGYDRLGQYPLPNINKLPIPNDWRSRIEQVMINEGHPGGPWMYKCAKACLIWPVFYFAFPRAKWIIVRRKTEDIVLSCIKTGFMRAFRSTQNQRSVGAINEAEGWTWWVNQHITRFNEMIEAGVNLKMIWPEKAVHGDYHEIMDMVSWLGLEWKSEVLGFIDPKLWKARRK